MNFRPYQLDAIVNGMLILADKGFVYLAMEVRTGKTLTSLGVARQMGYENVLFITKKKVIEGIRNDYILLDAKFNLEVINYESLHKAERTKYDLVILDEAHCLGAFPKPSSRAKMVKQIVKNTPVILLSGTPTPESYSQLYHQLYGIDRSPFKHPNFYAFAKDYVTITQKFINGFRINDYSNGSEKILDKMQDFMIKITQKEAGFSTEINENVLEVEMKPQTYALIKKLEKDLVIEGKNEVILADTGVKLMTKLHQLYSGTVKFESGNSMVIDYSKAEFIKERFATAKIGIFYKFKAELEALMKVYGEDNLTTDLNEFDNSKKSIALQIVAGREGISLRNADYLIYYNIDFSATSYWQSRDRMTTIERSENKVYWIFAKGGIEGDIYKSVLNKKDYTLTHFKNDRATNPNKKD